MTSLGGGVVLGKKIELLGIQEGTNHSFIKSDHLSNQKLVKVTSRRLPGEDGPGREAPEIFFSFTPLLCAIYGEKSRFFGVCPRPPPPLTIQEDNSRWAGVYISANCACTWIFFQFYPPPPLPGQFIDRVVNLSRGIYCTNFTYLSNQVLVKVTSRWHPWEDGPRQEAP